ncbi:MAG: histidine phosphatase family protein, partial [Pseudomonadota bacterium]
MGEVFFVRHGQASFGTGDYDRLSDLGWQQARWLGQHLAEEGRSFDLMVSGALRRHRETASAMAEHLDISEQIVLPGLDELDYDHLQADAFAAGIIPPPTGEEGAIAAELPKVMHGWEHQSFDTAHEPFEEFRTRVTDAVGDVTAEGREVLIVSSGGPKAVMMRHVLGLGPRKMSEVLLCIYNSSYTRFLVREGELRLSEFNAIPHLAGAGRAHARTYI